MDLDEYFKEKFVELHFSDQENDIMSSIPDVIEDPNKLIEFLNKLNLSNKIQYEMAETCLFQLAGYDKEQVTEILKEIKNGYLRFDDIIR
jgi:hypothetical protein